MIPVPQGWTFLSAKAGFKRPDTYDLGLAMSETPATAAGVFTTNLVQAAPVIRCKELLAEGRPVRCVAVNSGQANACTGEEGLADCRVAQELAAGVAGCGLDEVLPASTGVIGPRLRLERWIAACEAMAQGGGPSGGDPGPEPFAKAMMTTDTFPKLAWAEVEHDGRTVRVLGMAKGAGMICPDMATMLGFVFTDADVDAAWWREMLRRAANASFNRVTVDGDTSTNDTLLALANGASGVAIGTADAEAALEAAVTEVCQALAYMIVQDAEGGTKVARISVAGAEDDAQADLAARAVGHSPLVKTALFGQDPNWGRIVAAVGRSGARFDPDALTLAFGDITVYAKGRPMAEDMDTLLAPLMRRQEIDIRIGLGDGPGTSTLLASDLSREYVSINADYRS